MECNVVSSTLLGGALMLTEWTSQCSQSTRVLLGRYYIYLFILPPLFSIGGATVLISSLILVLFDDYDSFTSFIT